MHHLIYEDKDFYIEKEVCEIPWLKIFTKEPYRELSELPDNLRQRLWQIYILIEKEMLAYYHPKKVNMASFANMLPRVHIHVMARFENDSYFPNPMWGEKLREANLELPDEDAFFKNLFHKLNQLRENRS